MSKKIIAVNILLGVCVTLISFMVMTSVDAAWMGRSISSLGVSARFFPMPVRPITPARFIIPTPVFILTPPPTPAPVKRQHVNPLSIFSLDPNAGSKGTLVTIHGSGFTPTENRIKFGNLGIEQNPHYNLNSNDGTTLTFTVPYSNYLACWHSVPFCAVPSYTTPPGNYQVSVINANGQSNSMTFTVTTNSN